MPSNSNCLCPSRKFCPAKLGITLVLDVLELRVDHVTAHRGDRLTPGQGKARQEWTPGPEFVVLV